MKKVNIIDESRIERGGVGMRDGMNEEKAIAFTFGMEHDAHIITEAIRLAIEEVMPEVMNDNNFQERNGYGQFRWNAIIAQLREYHHLGWLDFGVCKRGAWKTPILFHRASRYLLSFMTEETFAGVQRRKEKGKHYLCGGASYNKGLTPKLEQIEMDLPHVSNDYEKWIAKSRDQLACAIKRVVGEIDGHILVIFEVRNDKLLSIRAVRLTHELAISTEEENWSGFIRKPFDATENVIPEQTEEETENLVELL